MWVYSPYNNILGGKLVCMLLASPEISNYYKSKYNETQSIIASSMKGEALNKKQDLFGNDEFIWCWL